MKDFLKDVPKLENLPKALYNGVEHYLIRHNDGFDILPVEDTLAEWEWAQSHQLKPIPELTHWEASDFHKWFAENGMEDAYVFIYGMWHLVDNISKNELTFFDKKETDGGDYGIVSLGKNIKAISKYGNLESTPCTKPIKS